MRIWRDWLAKQKDPTERLSELGDVEGDDEGDNKSPDSRMLWTDSSKNVGLRVRVRRRKWRREVPVLIHQDEDSPVSYSIDLEGKFMVPNPN